MELITDLSEAEVQSLTQSILVRYGIDFTCYEPKSLKRRIVRLMNILELPSVHELWIRFLKDQSFIQRFMNEISVGMTSMFRDPQMWRELQQRMRYRFATKNNLEVWHSGCSTGEEVYSLGILLQELHLIDKTHAHCTDINMQAIDEARSGVYHKIKMIENESNYRQYNSSGNFSSYYKADGTHVHMNPELLQHTDFYYHHLVNDPFPDGFDMIFCRNVMIYLDTAAKAKLLEKFYKSLKPGGYFIIGYFDTMGHLMDNSRFRIIDEDARIFEKI